MWIIQILFWASFITFLFGAQRTIALSNLHSDYSDYFCAFCYIVEDYCIHGKKHFSYKFKVFKGQRLKTQRPHQSFVVLIFTVLYYNKFLFNENMNCYYGSLSVHVTTGKKLSNFCAYFIFILYFVLAQNYYYYFLVQQNFHILTGELINHISKSLLPYTS